MAIRICKGNGACLAVDEFMGAWEITSIEARLKKSVDLANATRKTVSDKT
jgi:hypothetical protein